MNEAALSDRSGRRAELTAGSAGSGYVQELAALASQHRAVRHPYLRALQSAELPNPRLAVLDLAHQYLPYNRSFPRFLAASIAQLDSEEHRRALLYNLLEERGRLSAERLDELERAGVEPGWVEGVAHPELFQRFLSAVGMTPQWLEDHPSCDDARVWSELFLQCCRSGGGAQAVGALGLGTESIVSTVYRPLLEAIQRHTDVEPADRVFFDLHCTVDDAHGDVLIEIAAEVAERGAAERASLRLGTLMALNLRAGFYDAMLVRAMEMPREEDVQGL